MDAVVALRMLGGAGSFAEIVGMSSRRKVDGAVRSGEIKRVGRPGTSWLTSADIASAQSRSPVCFPI